MPRSVSTPRISACAEPIIKTTIYVTLCPKHRRCYLLRTTRSPTLVIRHCHHRYTLRGPTTVWPIQKQATNPQILMRNLRKTRETSISMSVCNVGRSKGVFKSPSRISREESTLPARKLHRSHLTIRLESTARNQAYLRRDDPNSSILDPHTASTTIEEPHLRK